MASWTDNPWKHGLTEENFSSILRDPGRLFYSFYWDGSPQGGMFWACQAQRDILSDEALFILLGWVEILMGPTVSTTPTANDVEEVEWV